MNETTPAQPPRKRRWFRRLVGLVLVLLFLVVAGPWLVSNPPLRDPALWLATLSINGKTRVDQLQLGWLSSIRVDGLQIDDRQGRPVIRVERIENNRSLAALLSNRDDLGTTRIIKPELHLVATRERNNLLELFPDAAVAKDDPKKREQAARATQSARLAIDDLHVTWCGNENERRWEVVHLSAACELQGADPAAGRPAQLVIAPVKVFDHFDASPQLCDDLLKYIAPALAGVASADGAVSLELDGGKFPLGDPTHAELSGRLIVHSLALGPTPFVQTLISKFGLPGSMTLARESHIEFQLSNGRMHHDGMELGSELIRVRTRGSVGIVDQSLDVMAEVRLTLDDKTMAQRPLLRAIAQQTLRIPIVGTLQKPEIDTQRIGNEGLNILSGALGNVNQSPDASLTTGGLGALLDGLRQSGVLGGPAEGDKPAPLDALPAATATIAGSPAPATAPGAKVESTATVSQAVDTAIDILQELAKRRRERLARDEAARNAPPAPADAAPAPATGSEPPRKRLLGRALDRLRQDQPAPSDSKADKPADKPGSP